MQGRTLALPPGFSRDVQVHYDSKQKCQHNIPLRGALLISEAASKQQAHPLLPTTGAEDACSTNQYKWELLSRNVCSKIIPTY